MEPLRSVLDRVGRDRRDRRINRWLTAAACIVIPLLILGPLAVPATSWYAQGKLDKGDAAGAESALRLIDHHPILALDRARNPARLAGLASANLQLARTLVPPGDNAPHSDADYLSAFAAVDRALRMSPDPALAKQWHGTLERQIDDRVANHDSEGVLRLLEAAGALCDSPDLIGPLSRATDALFGAWRKTGQSAVAASESSEALPSDLDKVEAAIGRLKNVLQTLRKAESSDAQQAAGAESDMSRFLHGAMSRLQSTSALLSLAHGSLTEGRGLANESAEEALRAGPADARVALAEAVDAQQQISRHVLNTDMNLLELAANQKGHALPDGTRPGDKDYYAKLLDEVRTSVAGAPGLARQASETLQKRELNLWTRLRNAISDPNPAAIAPAFNDNLRALQAITDLRASATASASAAGEVNPIDLAEGMFAYRQLEQWLASPASAPPAAAAFGKFSPWYRGGGGAASATAPTRQRIEKATETGIWPMSVDAEELHARVDNALASFCSGNLRPGGADDKALGTAAQLGVEAEPSPVTRHALDCVAFYLSAASVPWAPGTSVPNDRMAQLFPAVRSLVVDPSVRAMLASALDRLQEPPRPIEAAFAVRRMLGCRAGDGADAAAAITAIDAKFDGGVIQPPPAGCAAERWGGLMADYVNSAAADTRAAPLLTRLMKTALVLKQSYVIKPGDDFAAIAETSMATPDSPMTFAKPTPGSMPPTPPRERPSCCPIFPAWWRSGRKSPRRLSPRSSQSTGNGCWPIRWMRSREACSRGSAPTAHHRSCPLNCSKIASGSVRRWLKKPSRRPCGLSKACGPTAWSTSRQTLPLRRFIWASMNLRSTNISI